MHSQASKHSILLLFSLLLLYFHNPIAAEDPIFTKCYNSSNYTSGSQYETNLKNILSSLSTNGVLLKDKYYNTAEGNGANIVFGFSQCMSAASEDACRECLTNSTAEIVRQCPNKTQASIRYTNCILRYSNENLFPELDVDVRWAGYPVQNVSNITLFNNQLVGLMEDLSSTASSAASKYSVKVTKYSYFQNIYGMAQCTRDLSEEKCYTCLRTMINNIGWCCSGRTGGNVYSVSCNIRYDMYLFFTLPPGPSAPPLPSVVDSPQDAGYMPSPPPSVVESPKGTAKNNRLLSIVLPLAIFGILIMVSMRYFLQNGFKRQGKSPFCSRRWRKKTNTDVEPKACNTLKCGEDIVELPLYTFGSIMAATNNFSTENMLGEGGFGKVYKGNLNQVMEIAVKRLSKSSVQGEEEFKNEIQLIAKLQHKNLVRLLGLCVYGEEKILIYEFMPNKSLDKFLFDPTKKLELDWNKRFHIIQGVAQGLLYLHHYSRLKVIHRDLKTSNILLDASLTPKISDFGLARIFQGNQTEANTNRVMGTYGYMSPEYALDGIFSEKSDVYSLGILMLEILSAKKNKGFYPSKYSINLVGFAWQLWIEGKGIELMDPSMDGSFVTREVMTCIHIALLCVQEDPADRPAMSSVVSMLGNESITLPSPKQPAFSIVRLDVHSAQNISGNFSINGVTLSTVCPR